MWGWLKYLRAFPAEVCRTTVVSAFHPQYTEAEGRRSRSGPVSSITVCSLLSECSAPPTCRTSPGCRPSISVLVDHEDRHQQSAFPGCVYRDSAHVRRGRNTGVWFCGLYLVDVLEVKFLQYWGIGIRCSVQLTVNNLHKLSFRNLQFLRATAVPAGTAESAY